MPARRLIWLWNAIHSQGLALERARFVPLIYSIAGLSFAALIGGGLGMVANLFTANLGGAAILAALQCPIGDLGLSQGFTLFSRETHSTRSRTPSLRVTGTGCPNHSAVEFGRCSG